MAAPSTLTWVGRPGRAAAGLSRAPPAVAGLDGEAKDMWKAAGGGTTIKWEKVRAQLKKSGGKGYADCEAIVSKALGVPSVDDGSATVPSRRRVAALARACCRASARACCRAEAARARRWCAAV